MVARPPLALPLAALAALGALLLLVLTDWPPLAGAHERVAVALRAYGLDRPATVAALRVATDVAALWTFLLAGSAAALALRLRGAHRPAVLCAIVTVAVPVSWAVGHWLVHHPRPVDGFVAIDSNGFPSGHTANAAAAALCAVLLAWPRSSPARRAVVVTLGMIFALFVGATRLLLLAHWPADVLGGWLLALVVVPLAARAAHRVPDPSARPELGVAGSPVHRVGAGQYGVLSHREQRRARGSSDGSLPGPSQPSSPAGPGREHGSGDR